jgi:c-di-GMP-binding flagellar brake protein YcgR
MGKEIPITTGQRMLEQRQNQRYKSQGNAKVRKLETELLYAGRILDISARGCLLQMPGPSPFTVDTLVDMSVNTSWVTFRALGSVRNIHQNHWKIGVSFVKLTQRGEAELLELIASLEKAKQSKRSSVLEMSIARHDPSPQNHLDTRDQ